MKALITGMTGQDSAFGYIGDKIRDYIKINAAFYRPADINTLVGDSSKIKKDLGWKPKISWQEMCREMVEADLLKY